MISIFDQYVSPKRILLVGVEGGLIALALVCGARLRFYNAPGEFNAYVQMPEFALQALLVVITFQVCLFSNNFYNLSGGPDEQLICLGESLGAGCLLLGIMYYLFPSLIIGRGVFFISALLIITFITLSRLALDAAWRVAGHRQRILILGTGHLAETVARELARRQDLNALLVGFVRTSGDEPSLEATGDAPVLGHAERLDTIASRQRVDRIVVAMENRRGSLPIRDLVKLRVRGIRVEDAQSTIAGLTGRVWLDTIHPSWFVFSDGFRRSRIPLMLKRAVDLCFGIAGLIVSLPFMLLVAAAVWLESTGPVLFRQTRVGWKGREFELLKFRSMRADAEKDTGARWAQPGDPRVTRVGRFLRKFRLDELPQFVNVIRGDMSLVGPRPERPAFVAQLREQIAYYDERHSARPGLTGWAQVQYPYGASVKDALRKLEYDLFYLKNMSVFFDVAILLRTVRIVLTGQGGR